MVELKKGHNFAIQGPTEKKICIRLFFVLMLYIKFQVPSSSSSLVLQPTKGVMDRRTDRPKPICSLNFIEVGGIIIGGWGRGRWMDRRTGTNQFAPSTSSKLGA